MNVVNQWLLMVALQSTVLLTVFLGLLRWWTTNPFSRHTLSSIAITSCMFLPLGMWLVPATITSLLAKPATLVMAAAVMDTDVHFSQHHEQTGLPVLEEMIAPATLPQIPTIAHTALGSGISSIPWDRSILILWAIGLSVMIATRLAEQVKLRRLARVAEPIPAPAELLEHLKLVFGQPKSPCLLTLDHAFVPFVVGILRPAIVLPRMLLSDRELLKQVVTHEQAHIHRRDTWGLLWQQIVSAVFWWQPLLKLINRELSAARESIADSYVVSQCDPIRYTESILRLAETVHLSQPTALAFLNQPPTLEDRVRYVLTQRTNLNDQRQWTCRSVSIAASTIVLFLCGGVAIQSQLAAREPADETKQTTADTASNTTSYTTAVATPETNLEPTTKATPETVSRTTQVAAEPPADKDDELHLGPMIQDDEPRFVNGRVLSPSGEPVNDCLLLTEVVTKDRKVQNISTRTDRQGEYKLTLPGNVSHLEAYHTWIYKEGYGLRAVAFGYKLTRTHRWNNCTIVLPVADRMTVRVQDPNGQPVAGAIIEPTSYQLPNGSFSADSSEGLSSDPPAEIIELVRAKTNSEGFVELNCFNTKLMGGLHATSDIYGTQRFGSVAKQNWQIQFRPVGSVRFKLVGGDATKVKGSMLNILTEPMKQSQSFAAASGMVQVSFDGQSEFVVPKIPEGQLQIFSWFWLGRKEYLPVIEPGLAVSPGVETVVEVQLVPSIEVTGRIVLQDSLLPAKRVRLSIRGRGAFSDGTETDDQGNFKLYALPGPAQISFNAPGANTFRSFRQPKTRDVLVPQASPLTVPDIVMEKTPELTIHLSDASGQPLIDTEVIMAIQFGERIRPLEKLKTTRAGSCSTPLDFDESEKRLRERDPRSGIRFYLASDYIEKDPQTAVPLKEIRRGANELWLQK